MSSIIACEQCGIEYDLPVQHGKTAWYCSEKCAELDPTYKELQSELTGLRSFVRSQFKFSTEYYEGFCDEGVFYIREVGGPERVQARGDNALVAIEKLIRKEV